MFCHINKWPRQLSSGRMPISYQGLCRPVHPRAASGPCPSIIKAYADQCTRARRQLRLLDRPGGCEHLKYDRFKMYIDQGVHFQIRINKSILLIHSISPVCKTKYFEMRAPKHSVSKSVLRHRDVRLSYGSYFETC